MQIDRTGLHDRIFEIANLTDERNYYFITNLKTHVTRWSQKAVEYFGLPAEYVFHVDELWASLIHPDDLASYRKTYEMFFAASGSEVKFEYRIKNAVGKYVFITSRCRISCGEDGKPDLVTGCIVNNEIANYIDPITKLRSSNDFVLRLSRMIDENRMAGVMKLAINVFNHFNVMYGYEYGDEILRVFGEKIKSRISDVGTVYRLDGAKFAVIFDQIHDEWMISEYYKKIKNIAEKEIIINGIATPIQICGSAMILNKYQGNAVTVKSELSYALGISKEQGVGDLIFFHNVQKKDEQKLSILSAIHRSILDGCKGFYLCYQPLVDAATQKVVGAEALLRWRNDVFGEVSPGTFIPWIEADPAFYELGKWIFRTAIRDMKRIKKEHPHFVLNVNITASQLQRTEFRRDVLEIVEEEQYPPGDLFMELTERCRDLDYKFLRDEITFFHEHGMRISLDDFGTGSASLSLLKELPIDELKIDMSFIRNIETNPVDQTLVASTVWIAKQMGLKTCLEGVETESISDYLSQHEATYYQGYRYSKPVVIEEFAQVANMSW